MRDRPDTNANAQRLTAGEYDDRPLEALPATEYRGLTAGNVDLANRRGGGPDCRPAGPPSRRSNGSKMSGRMGATPCGTW